MASICETETNPVSTSVRNRAEILLKLPGRLYLAEILLGQRTSAKYVGLIRCPGGQIEANESALSTAIRELYEEYGIQLRSSDLKFVGFRRGELGDITRYVAKASSRWEGLLSNTGRERLIITSKIPD